MKRNHKKHLIFSGLACAAWTAASTWHAVTFNESRFVIPMDLSEYSFRAKDLPMILSAALCVLYILYLFVLLIQAILTQKQKEASAQVTRS